METLKDGRGVITRTNHSTIARRARRTIRAALLDAGAIDELDYEHMRPSEEPILWIADAVAWAFGAGPTWRRRVDGIVAVVRRVDP